MAVSHGVPISGETRAYIQASTVESDSRLSISSHWRRVVEWLREENSSVAILFLLREPGRATGFCYEQLIPRVDELVDPENPELERLSGLALFLGRWQKDQTLIVPPPVVAHLLGQTASVGSIWAWACRDRIELLSQAAKERETAKAVAKISTALALE